MKEMCLRTVEIIYQVPMKNDKRRKQIRMARSPSFWLIDYKRKLVWWMVGFNARPWE